jgi:stage IV sporulation protein A
MVENKILEDLTERCGGNICIGVAGQNNAGKSAIINAFKSECDGVSIVELSDFDAALINNVNFNLYVIDENGGGELKENNSVADDKIISELKGCVKPLAIIINSANNSLENVQQIRGNYEQKYAVPTATINGENVSSGELFGILKVVLFQFPVTSLNVNIPEWVRVMPKDSSAVAELIERVRTACNNIKTLQDCGVLDGMLLDAKYWKGVADVTLTPSSGCVEVAASIKDGILYDMLSEICGESITDECTLMSYVAASSQAKRGYDKIKDALECAKVTGYGIVEPSDGDLSLDKPQVVRQGGNVGIKLKATAPSYHIVKVDVSGEVSPIMGSAATSEEMVNSIMSGFDADPIGMWDTNIFGKSLRGMVKEGLDGKVTNIQDDTRNKLRKAITRMVNESKGGVICILL